MEKTFQPDPLAIRLENWQWRQAASRLMAAAGRYGVRDWPLLLWALAACVAGIQQTEQALDVLARGF